MNPTSLQQQITALQAQVVTLQMAFAQTQKELEDLISNEKEAISSDKDLKKKFAEIEKLIQKNVTVREFEAYLQNHEELLAAGLLFRVAPVCR